jgi:hypothetical protein
LSRYIKRRRNFIGNDDLGLGRKSTSNRNALTLTARKLEGIPITGIGIDCDCREGSINLGPVTIQSGANGVDGLGQRLPDCAVRVEGRVGILGYELYATSRRTSRSTRCSSEVYPIEDNRASIRSVKTHNRFGYGRLARTRFAHDAQSRSLDYCQVDSSKHVGAP